MKDELYHIISGKKPVSFGTTIQAIACYLRESEKASSTAKNKKYHTKQEKTCLEEYISQKFFWIDNLDFSQYVSEGAEQKVYLKNGKSVIKLNEIGRASCRERV